MIAALGAVAMPVVVTRCNNCTNCTTVPTVPMYLCTTEQTVPYTATFSISGAMAPLEIKLNYSHFSRTMIQPVMKVNFDFKFPNERNNLQKNLVSHPW